MKALNQLFREFWKFISLLPGSYIHSVARVVLLYYCAHVRRDELSLFVCLPWTVKICSDPVGKAARVGVRRRMNIELNFPPNFERLVLGCIDADFASQYSLESPWRGLQELHPFAPLGTQFFRKNRPTFRANLSPKFRKLCSYIFNVLVKSTFFVPMLTNFFRN